MELNKQSKGFLFVVTVFLMLTYILLSISVWVKSIETSERAYSEFYKESNVELAMEQITSEKLDKVSSIILNRALFVLNNHSVSHPIKAGSPDEAQYVSASFSQWLVNGSPDQSNFEDGIAPSENSSSLSAWAKGLNASLASIGVYVDDVNVSNFQIYQSDIDVLNYSFTVDLKMADKSGTTSVVRKYNINNSLNITGIPDPAIARASGGLMPGRRFYFEKSLYSDGSALRPITRYSGTSNSAGQDWFYGYLTNASAAGSVNQAEKKSYAIVGTYDEIRSVQNFSDFGAFIVTTPANHPKNCTRTDGTLAGYFENGTFNPLKYTGNNCDPEIDKSDQDATTKLPFVVAPGFSIDSAGDCPDIPNKIVNRKCALFVTAYNSSDTPVDKKLSYPNIRIYDIESLRDFTLCGYYIHDPNAPSYVQRLFNNSYSYNSSNGISTFLIGQYVNGTPTDSWSRLDWELFGHKPGFEVRGMPGCKDPSMCTLSETLTGRFMLSKEALEYFGILELGCNYPGIAGCKR